MNLETLTALQGSIEKWEAIVNGIGTDQGASNCPLCALFLPPLWIDKPNQRPCEGCPVYEKTGIVFCEGSPYEDFCNAEEDSDMEALAQEELDFLKSLLPSKE